MEQDDVKLGERVTWKSQAGGSWTKKYGRVIYKGEPSVLLRDTVADKEHWLSEGWRFTVQRASHTQRRFDGGGQGVIVAVDYMEKLLPGTDVKRFTEAQRFVQARIYAPRVKLLEYDAMQPWRTPLSPNELKENTR